MKTTDALVLLAAFSACASAHPPYLSGTVGTAPVFADLDRNGGKVSGWYYYLRIGKEIRLEGVIDSKGHFVISESDYNTSKKTGSFDGTVSGAHWTGTWHDAGGTKALPFTLDETRDALNSTSGHFKCASKSPRDSYGAEYTSSVDLTLAKGAVKGFTVSREMAAKNGDQQSCSISLDDLKREKTDEGILLRAKADNTNDDGANALHCTVRIVGAGDYFVVQVGDTSESNNECREASDTMFCSPRGTWADVIVNRKTQACRAVQ